MNLWLKLPRFIRFIIIGCINAAISYVIFAVATYIIGQEQYQICVALQWFLSSFISYLNQKFFVFCTRGNYVKEYLKCCSTWLISYLLNVVITENVYISQFAALATVSVVTYIMFKLFAFKK